MRAIAACAVRPPRLVVVLDADDRDLLALLGARADGAERGQPPMTPAWTLRDLMARLARAPEWLRYRLNLAPAPPLEGDLARLDVPVPSKERAGFEDWCRDLIRPRAALRAALRAVEADPEVVRVLGFPRKAEGAAALDEAGAEEDGEPLSENDDLLEEDDDDDQRPPILITEYASAWDTGRLLARLDDADGLLLCAATWTEGAAEDLAEHVADLGPGESITVVVGLVEESLLDEGEDGEVVEEGAGWVLRGVGEPLGVAKRIAESVGDLEAAVVEIRLHRVADDGVVGDVVEIAVARVGQRRP